MDSLPLKRLLANAGKLLGYSSVAGLLAAATSILAARVLGLEAFGILALVQAYVMVVSQLVSFQSWQAIVKFGSQALARDDREQLRQLVKFGVLLDVATGVVGFALAMALAGTVERVLGWPAGARPLMRLLACMILFNWNGTPVGLLRLLDHFDWLGRGLLAGAGVRLIGVALCAVLAPTLPAVVVAYLVAGIVERVFLFVVALCAARARGADRVLAPGWDRLRGEWRALWDYVWTTNLNSTLRMLSREADMMIVGTVVGPAGAGLFKIAKTFARLAFQLLNPLYQALYPELARLHADGLRCAFLALMGRFTALTAALGAAIWMGFLVAGAWLVRVLFGEAFQDAYGVALVYLLAAFLAFAGFALQPAMLACGKPRTSFVAQAAATVAYFLLLIPLLQRLGALGASWAYVGYYALWSAIMIVALRRHFAVWTGAASAEQTVEPRA